MKPDESTVQAMNEDARLRAQETEYVAKSLECVTMTITEKSLAEFPSQIHNVIRFKQKRITPKVSPRIIIYYHPGKIVLCSED